jgi:hypothetical protein
MKRLLLLAAFLLVLAGCDSAVPDDPNGPEPVTAGIIVASQGAFGVDDGGVITYRLDGTVAARYDDLFVQSATLHGEELFVTSSNSVHVLEASTLTHSHTYGGILNPRYVAFDGASAFVTSLYTQWDADDGFVTRLDLSTGTTAGSTTVGGNPDGIARIGGRVFVANYDWGSGRTVTVLDAASMQEVTRWEVACDGPRFLFEDQGRLVVACTGDAWGDPATNGALLILNPQNGATIDRVELPTTLGTASSGQLAALVPETRELYAIDDSSQRVYRFDLASGALAATLQVDGAPLNAVAYDPRREYLYLGRLNASNPYTANGTLTVHTRQGDLVDTFQGAGVVPTHITLLTATEQ